MHIETLWDAYVHSVTIRLECAAGRVEGLKTVRECHFKTDLDVKTLVCTRGRDMPITMLQDRMRCPLCKARRVRLVFGLPTNTNVQAARRKASY